MSCCYTLRKRCTLVWLKVCSLVFGGSMLDGQIPLTGGGQPVSYLSLPPAGPHPSQTQHSPPSQHRGSSHPEPPPQYVLYQSHPFSSLQHLGYILIIYRSPEVCTCTLPLIDWRGMDCCEEYGEVNECPLLEKVRESGLFLFNTYNVYPLFTSRGHLL